MSSVIPSTLRDKAESRYNAATLELQKIIPPNIQTQIWPISYLTSKKRVGVVDRIKVLEWAIEEILRYRDDLKDEHKRKRIGETVVWWFYASYPFANLFLDIMKDTSAVFVPLFDTN